jgi:hypothetical protein
MFLSFSHQRRLCIQVETEDGSVQEQIVTRKGYDLDRLTSRSSRLQDVSKKRKWVDLESNNDGLDSTNLNCLASDNSLPQSPTNFSKSLKIRCKYCGLIHCVPEACRIRALVAKEVKRQRPTDPRLLCCDYNAADVAFASGNWGGREYDLCLECLGAELQDKFPKIDNWESQALSEKDLWGTHNP